MSAYDYPPFNPEPLDEDCLWNTAGITHTDEEIPEEEIEDDASEDRFERHQNRED